MLQKTLELLHAAFVLLGMSPVGHSLVGIALGAAICPDRWCRRPLAISTGMAILSLTPDWPLPGWGHSAYLVSHSLWVNLGMVVVVATVTRSWLGKEANQLIIACAAAWLSHLLLDSFYNHRLGVVVGWPVNDMKFNLPIPWLQTLNLSEPPWSQHNVSVFVWEAITFGPLLLLILWRGATSKRSVLNKEEPTNRTNQCE